MSKQEEITKAIDEVVDKVLSDEEAKTEVKTDEVEKAMPASLDENGGKDKIKSGTPYADKKELKAKKEAKKSEEEDEENKVEKAEEDKPVEDKEEKEEKLEKKKKIKKSIEELADILNEDELELIKAWRSEEEEVPAEEKEEVTKSFSDGLDEKLESMTKAFEEKIDAKDEIIKSMNEKIEKMASQPAYEKRSVESLEAIEKSDDASQTINKAQILETMLAMQRAGKGINSRHIAEMEATDNISDPRIKQAVKEELKNNK